MKNPAPDATREHMKCCLERYNYKEEYVQFVLHAISQHDALITQCSMLAGRWTTLVNALKDGKTYEEIANKCRKDKGPCYCGCHRSVILDAALLDEEKP